MRNLTFILILTAQAAFGQAELVTELRSQIDMEWKKPNPEFTRTSTSYFNSNNIQDFYIAPINWSGRSIPFFWDCDLSALEFLISSKNTYEKLTGTDADEIYKGTKLKWKDVKATIWVNDNYYNVELTNWHVMELNDCPGTISFPAIHFTKTFELPNARTNNLEGLVFISDKSLGSNKTSASPTQLARNDGKSIKGTGYDLNNDQILDLFYFTELEGESEWLEGNQYNRLYANIGGTWKCIYVELLEVCI